MYIIAQFLLYPVCTFNNSFILNLPVADYQPLWRTTTYKIQPADGLGTALATVDRVLDTKSPNQTSRLKAFTNSYQTTSPPANHEVTASPDIWHQRMAR